MFFSGYVSGDDKHYLAQAYRFSIGDFAPGQNPWGNRLGLIIPSAFFMHIFGVNEFSYSLYPLICSLGNIILIYYFGKMLFSKHDIKKIECIKYLMDEKGINLQGIKVFFEISEEEE